MDGPDGRLAARLAGRAVRHRHAGRCGSGLGAVVFRYLIYFFTWLATGHTRVRPGRLHRQHAPALAGAGVLHRDPCHRRDHLRAADLPLRAGGPRPRRARGDAGGRGERRADPAPGQRGQGGRLRAVHRHRRVGRAGRARSCRSAPRWPPASASGCGCRKTGCGSWSPAAPRGGISATFNAPITGVFFGVEIVLREFSIDAHVHRDAVGDDGRRGRHPVPGQPAVPARAPAGHRAAPPTQLPARGGPRGGRRPDRPAVQERRVQDGRPVGPGLEEPARMGPARHRRHRPRPGPAGAAADVRRGLPRHVQGGGR